jgi:hypothetical protein
MSRIPL